MTVAIVYLPDQSRYTPRVDQFVRTGEGVLGNRLAWKGRALSVEEFNKEFPAIIKHSRLNWGVEPHVEIIEDTPTPAIAAPKPKAIKKPAPKPAKTKPGTQPLKAPVTPKAHVAGELNEP